jgi:hypothetical protein
MLNKHIRLSDLKQEADIMGQNSMKLVQCEKRERTTAKDEETNHKPAMLGKVTVNYMFLIFT